jgi:hypothetical protein
MLIGLRNLTPQTVDGLVNLGAVYRKNCRRNDCGIPTFSNTSDSVTLNHKGFYHVTTVLTVTADAATDVVVSLLQNGVELPAATTTVTLTADGFANVTLDYYILVTSNCVLGVTSITPATIQVSVVPETDTAVVTVSNIVTNVETTY